MKGQVGPLARLLYQWPILGRRAALLPSGQPSCVGQRPDFGVARDSSTWTSKVCDMMAQKLQKSQQGQ